MTEYERLKLIIVILFNKYNIGQNVCCVYICRHAFYFRFDLSLYITVKRSNFIEYNRHLKYSIKCNWIIIICNDFF